MTSTSWPACAEEQNRPELRVETASQDQLVTIELDHGLHAHALEMARPGPLATACSISRKALADCLGIGKVELHAAHVGLVGDRVGKELEDDRESDGGGGRDGFVLGRGDLGLDGRDSVGRQDLLRLDLGQHGAPCSPGGRDDRLGGCRCAPAWNRQPIAQAWGLVQRLEVVM